MYIFKLDRYLLDKKIREFSHYMHGRILDLGAGNHDRYGHYFNNVEHVKMDNTKSDNVDVVGSADDIPFPSDSFDSVVSTQVFEHLPNPEKAAGEVSRVLREGGYFLVTVPQTNELHSEPYDYWRYTRFGIVELFERHNLKLIELQQLGGFFSTITHMSMRYWIDRLHLHQHSFWGRLFSGGFTVMGKIGIALDSMDTSVANRKHTLGWCAVFKKLPLN